jgi:hypothetical protein
LAGGWLVASLSHMLVLAKYPTVPVTRGILNGSQVEDSLKQKKHDVKDVKWRKKIRKIISKNISFAVF